MRRLLLLLLLMYGGFITIAKYKRICVFINFLIISNKFNLDQY